MSPPLIRQLADEAALQDLAAKLVPGVGDGGVIYLEGGLGAGKTSFARGLLRALGHHGPVKSPTYTLVEPYQLPGLWVYHFDLYRLADPAEMEYLGVRDYFGPESLCLIEWPERGAAWLPTPDLRLQLRPLGGGRELQLIACSERGECFLKGLRN